MFTDIFDLKRVKCFGTDCVHGMLCIKNADDVQIPTPHSLTNLPQKMQTVILLRGITNTHRIGMCGIFFDGNDWTQIHFKLPPQEETVKWTIQMQSLVRNIGLILRWTSISTFMPNLSMWNKCDMNTRFIKWSVKCMLSTQFTCRFDSIRLSMFNRFWFYF